MMEYFGRGAPNLAALRAAWIGDIGLLRRPLIVI